MLRRSEEDRPRCDGAVLGVLALDRLVGKRPKAF